MAVVGEAFVELRPQIASNFNQQVQQQLTAPLERASSEAGKRAGATLSSSVSKGAEEAGRSAGKRFSLGLGDALQGLGAIFVARRVFSFFRESITQLSEVQKIGTQTAAAIRSTGGAANVTADQVGGLAKRIQQLTTVDDEAIQGAANILLTFTKVRNEVGKGNDVFDQATQAVTDMATAMGLDLSNAALQVGKALNDPILGVTALRRQGVQLTEQQRDQVKAFVESGDVLSAQKIILAELNTEFGRSAEALGGTLQGRLNRASEAFEQLQEKTAAALVPVVEFGAGVATALASVPGPVVAVTAGLAGLLAVGVGFVKLRKIIQDTVSELATLKIVKAIAANFEAAKFLGFADSLKALGSAALRAAPAIAALATVAIVFKKIGDEQAKVREVFDKVVRGVATTADVTGRSIRAMEQGLDRGVEGLERFANSAEGLRFIDQAARNTAAELINLAFATKNPADAALILNEAGRVLNESLTENKDAFNATALATERAGGAINETGQESEGAADAFDKLNEQVDDFHKTLDRTLGTVLDARDAQRDFKGAIDDLNEGLKKNGRSFSVNTEAGRKNASALDDVIERAEAIVDSQIKQGKVADDTASRNRALFAVLNQARNEILPGARGEFDKLIDSLKGQPGLTEPAIRSFRELDDKLKSIGVNSNIRTRVEAAIIDDPNISITEIDRILKDLKVTGTLRARIEAAVKAEIQASIVRISISQTATGQLRRILEFGPNAHTGGWITGPMSDVPIVAQRGEYVIQRRAAAALGPDILGALNRLTSVASLASIFERRRATRMHEGGSVVPLASQRSGADVQQLLAALVTAIARLERVQQIVNNITVTEVAGDPQATAFAVNARLGREATR